MISFFCLCSYFHASERKKNMYLVICCCFFLFVFLEIKALIINLILFVFSVTKWAAETEREQPYKYGSSFRSVNEQRLHSIFEWKRNELYPSSVWKMILRTEMNHSKKKKKILYIPSGLLSCSDEIVKWTRVLQWKKCANVT